jgi:hypothetical protein
LRAAKIAAGLKQAKKYSWTNYCKATLNAYKKVWKIHKA